MSKTHEERVARYLERQKNRGMVKVCVWAPAEQAGYIRNIAAQLREQAKDSQEIAVGVLNEQS